MAQSTLMKRGAQDRVNTKNSFLEREGKFQWYWAIKSSYYVCEHILDVFITAGKLENDSCAFCSGKSPEGKANTVSLLLVNISFL